MQSSLIVYELLALDKLVASIGAIALWSYRMGACSHKQVINIFCMILGHANKFIVSQARPHDKIASRLLFFLSRDDT